MTVWQQARRVREATSHLVNIDGSVNMLRKGLGWENPLSDRLLDDRINIDLVGRVNLTIINSADDNFDLI